MRRRWLSDDNFLLIVGFLSIFLFFTPCIYTYFRNSKEIEKENERLNSIAEEIYDLVEEEKYVLAKSKTASLVFSVPSTTDADKATENWDKLRKELYEVINEAEENTKE